MPYYMALLARKTIHQKRRKESSYIIRFMDKIRESNLGTEFIGFTRLVGLGLNFTRIRSIQAPSALAGGGGHGLHPVEGGSVLEPVDLLGVEGVLQHDSVARAVGVRQDGLQRLQDRGLA